VPAAEETLVDQQMASPDAGGETRLEPVLEIFPTQPREAGSLRPDSVRIVGPGRRERGYQAQLAALQSSLETRDRELEAASLVERGSARRLDRMERKLEAVREATVALEQKEHRLILALGGLQRENELLREKLALSAGASATPKLTAGSRRARPVPQKRSWFSRLVRRP
jgi:hypothetical protein